MPIPPNEHRAQCTTVQAIYHAGRTPWRPYTMQAVHHGGSTPRRPYTMQAIHHAGYIPCRPYTMRAIHTAGCTPCRPYTTVPTLMWPLESCSTIPNSADFCLHWLPVGPSEDHMPASCAGKIYGSNLHISARTTPLNHILGAEIQEPSNRRLFRKRQTGWGSQKANKAETQASIGWELGAGQPPA